MTNSFFKLDPFIKKLSDRRKNLGMSQHSLAKMTGISLPTVQRVFKGNKNTSFDSISKIASALGLSLTVDDNKKEEEIIADRAHQKAKELTKLVQGTSALESQGLDSETLKAIEAKIFSDLFKGSRSRLWSD